MGNDSPRGENKKYVSCHQLVLVLKRDTKYHDPFFYIV